MPFVSLPTVSYPRVPSHTGEMSYLPLHQRCLLVDEGVGVLEHVTLPDEPHPVPSVQLGLRRNAALVRSQFKGK